MNTLFVFLASATKCRDIVLGTTDCWGPEYKVQAMFQSHVCMCVLVHMFYVFIVCIERTGQRAEAAFQTRDRAFKESPEQRVQRRAGNKRVLQNRRANERILREQESQEEREKSHQKRQAS